ASLPNRGEYELHPRDFSVGGATRQQRVSAALQAVVCKPLIKVGTGHGVGLVVEYDEPAIGILVQQVDEALYDDAVDLYAHGQLAPVPTPCRSLHGLTRASCADQARYVLCSIRHPFCSSLQSRVS